MVLAERNELRRVGGEVGGAVEAVEGTKVQVVKSVLDFRRTGWSTDRTCSDVRSGCGRAPAPSSTIQRRST